ncbi:hypothetical protein TNCT_608191 [Trichonephila clavata]|uniref:Uncharacterized protein n=1 Tax=Trichonephila clavata TaxID=2740835 RepID=A0A8X6KG61_TRICU|nr:hypothetical protein TNCT_608191 [Trichonephila clavata]
MLKVCGYVPWKCSYLQEAFRWYEVPPPKQVCAGIMVRARDFQDRLFVVHFSGYGPGGHLPFSMEWISGDQVSEHQALKANGLSVGTLQPR